MDRNSRASLSPREVSVLRALKQNAGREISRDDLRLLVSMGLAVRDGQAIGLSPAGRDRLELEERANR
jgi:DNA-binding winged helix-turn-helix (wHTH) protein